LLQALKAQGADLRAADAAGNTAEGLAQGRVSTVPPAPP